MAARQFFNTLFPSLIIEKILNSIKKNNENSTKCKNHN